MCELNCSEKSVRKKCRDCKRVYYTQMKSQKRKNLQAKSFISPKEIDLGSNCQRPELCSTVGIRKKCKNCVNQYDKTMKRKKITEKPKPVTRSNVIKSVFQPHSNCAEKSVRNLCPSC